jgi:hypothetical protein
MGPKARMLLLLGTSEFIVVLSPVWREGFVLHSYNSCWHSLAQSLSGTSRVRLMITFYCLRFDTPKTWRSLHYILQGHGGPATYPGTGSFSSPTTACRATVEVFKPASTRDDNWLKFKCKVTSQRKVSLSWCLVPNTISPYTVYFWQGSHRRSLFHHCVLSCCLENSVSRCTVAYSLLLGSGSTCLSNWYFVTSSSRNNSTYIIYWPADLREG